MTIAQYFSDPGIYQGIFVKSQHCKCQLTIITEMKINIHGFVEFLNILTHCENCQTTLELGSFFISLLTLLTLLVTLLTLL